MRSFTSLAVAVLAAVPHVVGITPEQMLSAPRYGDAVPNPTGDFAVFSSTSFSWATGKSTPTWKLLNLTSGDISDWAPGAGISEIVFAGSKPTSILYLNGSNPEGNGGVSIYASDVLTPGSATLVASLPAPFSGLKAARAETGDVHFLVSTKANPDGTPYNPDAAEEPASSARIYSSIYVRHWDYWLSETKNAVFGGTLKYSCAANKTSWSFDGKLTNYVTGIAGVSVAESPLDLGGDTDYALSPDGSKVAFLTKDVDLPLANFTSSQIYLVPFTGSSADAVPINPRVGSKYPETEGASANPSFSPDSSQIAWTQMNGIYYESDRSQLYTATVDGEATEAAFDITRHAGTWDRAPGTPKWSHKGDTIFVDAADLARVRVFAVPVDAAADFVPSNITDEGAVVGFHPLPSGRVLVSDTKIWSSRDITSVSADGKGEVTVYYQANLNDPELKGLGPEDVSEFYYTTNTSESKQQAWVVYPEGFDSSKKYPLAYIIHGGPQGAHANSWSTRWNFKVWADQGYVVVAPNPTASTGFGQNLTDSVQGRWGSYPFWDVLNAWQHVKDNYPFIDTTNAIEAGASFGGYMTNWIQGHDFGREFKALVTHDGCTSTLNQYASEELWFMDHDFKGPFNQSGLQPGSPYYDWNPLLYTDSWATPHFVIHNDLDFRLPVSEGLLLFNVLQTKGVPSKFLNFPDENHWVLNRQNSLVWHKEIFKWINFYTGLSEESPF